MLLRIVLLLVVLFFVFTIVVGAARTFRRRWGGRPIDPPLNVDFSVADLEAMRAKGQISPGEFDRAREIVLRRAQERDAESDRSRGHAFAVIQDPPLATPAPSAPPTTPTLFTTSVTPPSAPSATPATPQSTLPPESGSSRDAR
jgi:hypothetical protein